MCHQWLQSLDQCRFILAVFDDFRETLNSDFIIRKLAKMVICGDVLNSSKSYLFMQYITKCKI